MTKIKNKKKKKNIWRELPYYWAVSMALSHTCIYKAVFNKMTAHGMCFGGVGEVVACAL